MMLPALSRVLIGDLYYILDIGNKSAEVTYKSFLSDNMDYVSGNLLIPETVNYGDITYTVTTIGSSAFNSCTGLTSVIIPNSVTSIGDHAFEECTGLTSIEIPTSVSSIGNNAFLYCCGLTNIEIPNSVKSIGDGAFTYCTGFKSIEIPSSVTTIGNNAFSCCTSLASIVIPNSVKSIGEHVFSWCDGLTKIDVDSDNCYYQSYEDILYSKGLTTLICCPGGKTGSVKIPDSVTTIGDGAFWSCKGLTNIILGNSVSSIEDRAFYGTNGLTSFVFPNSVITIGNEVFWGNVNLKSIYIGEKVNCIGEAAFGTSHPIEKIIVAAQVPPSATKDIFPDEVYTDAKLYVPERAINSYKETTPWSDFFNIKSLDELSDSDGQTDIKIVPVLTVGEKLRLVAKNVDDRTLTEIQSWSSSDSSVATVNEDGMVTAISRGNVLITGTSENGKTTDIELEVISGSPNSNIDYVISVTNEDDAVFTTSGIKVLDRTTQEDLKTLAPGIYIIGGKKVMVR